MFTTILFDLDGTLTDPFEGITGGILYALKGLNYECPPREELVSFIGPPLFDEFIRCFGMDEDTSREAVRLYREYYLDGGMYENKLINGAEATLGELKAMGKRVCLATSKPKIIAEKILEHFGLNGYFDYIGGATMDGTIGTKEQVVRLVLEQTGAQPSECVLVGDRFHDIVGAHSVGMPCIAVLTGYGSQEEFEQYNADFVAETLSDAVRIIREKEIMLIDE